MKHNQNHHHLLARQQVALDSKHLGGDTRSEAVHLSGVLLDLSRVEERLQSTRLLRQLE